MAAGIAKYMIANIYIIDTTIWQTSVGAVNGRKNG